ncbi:chromosome segregation protein SMC [Corallococcus exercitus]|uniref:AAA family ATPase n=1 Tax=Corallococcus exercitus TaxID=2316736 RepID=UPI000EA34AE0|nr:AAA family ATPase [Corallococcus exercitus]RKG80916.1 chromosome segregation protein SMC [Corallococcus exercitus]
MRLNKLTIGSPKNGQTHQFKNLKDITIDFDQNQWVSVIIGWNGTGKSNILEALAVIFRELIGGKKIKIGFSFKLSYTMGPPGNAKYIHIDHDPDRIKDQFHIHVATDQDLASGDSAEPLRLARQGDHPVGKAIKLGTFLAEGDAYLPRYVFSYYSGESTRMHEVFRPYLESYDSKLRNGEDPGMKRLFYAMPVHSQFVLLAFLIQQTPMVRDFLDVQLGLNPDEGIESVLFVLREPPWKSKAPDGDPRFWNARGVVRDFLARLYDIALAPIEVKRRVATSIWNKETLQFKYLYIKNIDALRVLVGDQPPAQFFRDLESTYVSELIEEVRIKLRLRKNDDTVTFRELSEGEQQLLTVLGLLRFTAEEESLFLLDEPDTHLNPRWSVDYLGYLEKFIGSDSHRKSTSHILLTTHNPLGVAELVKEQVQILRLETKSSSRQLIACHPEMDPRGMGYAAIVTSDMFGIASSLDQPTQLLLERQRNLAGKSRLTSEEQSSLDLINGQLGRLGFMFFHPDDEYSRYLRLRNNLLTERFNTENASVLADHVVQLTRDEREGLAKTLISKMLEEEEALNES